MPNFVLQAPLELEVPQSPSLGHDDFGINSPAFDFVVGASTVEIISLRSPQYGIPLDARLAFLAEQLPNGVERHIGLFSTLPSRAGVGGTELNVGGYARVAHSSWRSSVYGGFVARRHNNGEIRFAAFDSDVVVAGWGAWSLPTGGVLTAFGLLRDTGMNSRVWDVPVGDTPGWLDGQLTVGIM